MAEPPLVYLRDLSDVEPPRDRYAHYDEEDIYRLVPRPQWTGLEDEIWTPRSQEHDPQLEKVKALMKRNSSDANGDSSGPNLGSLGATTKFASKCALRRVIADDTHGPVIAAAAAAGRAFSHARSLMCTTPTRVSQAGTQEAEEPARQGANVPQPPAR